MLVDLRERCGLETEALRDQGFYRSWKVGESPSSMIATRWSKRYAEHKETTAKLHPHV